LDTAVPVRLSHPCRSIPHFQWWFVPLLSLIVFPAQAGIQVLSLLTLDTRFRGYDGNETFRHKEYFTGGAKGTKVYRMRII
jgi:hypothetical protein